MVLVINVPKAIIGYRSPQGGYAVVHGVHTLGTPPRVHRAHTLPGTAARVHPAVHAPYKNGPLGSIEPVTIWQEASGQVKLKLDMNPRHVSGR